MSLNPIAGSRQIMQKSNKGISPAGRLMPNTIMLFSRLFSKCSCLEFGQLQNNGQVIFVFVILNGSHEMIVKTPSGR